MKLALVSPYDFAIPGGVNAHIEHLAREYVRLGHAVWILAPSSQPVTPLEGTSFARLGMPVPVPSGGSVARVSVSLWLFRKLRALLAREEFDVIHIHEPLTPLLPWLVLQASRTVNIGTFHAFHGRSNVYPLARRPLRRWFNRLHGRIAVSPAAEGFVQRHFQADYRIIPNGIDVDDFARPRPPIPELDDGMVNILFVGRLEKRKGLKYLLKAYCRLKWEHPEVRLVVVGPGAPDRDSHRVLAEHAVQDVVFAGGVSRSELPRYYQSAHVFCSPATGKESFGIVLLEAMAAGRPIVASNIEGYAAVVRDGVDGLLAAPRNDLALAEGLRTLIEDPEMRARMGQAGRLRAPEFAWDRVAGRVLDYYEDVREQFLAGTSGVRVPPAA